MSHQNTQKLSILLVDDDLDDQFFFRESIMHIDQEIDLSVASSGKEAEKKIKEFKPCIIFLDINMPGQSGKEFLENIRCQNEFKDVSVIMFTTSSNQDDIKDCYRLGANLFVTKPLSSVEQGKLMQKIFKLYSEGNLFTGELDKFVFKN